MLLFTSSLSLLILLLGLLLLVASGDAARVEEVKLRPATAGEDPNTSVDATTVMPVDGEKGSIRRAKKKPAKKTIDNDDDDVSSEEKDQDEAGANDGPQKRLTSIERRLSRVERQFAALFKRVNRSKNGSSDDEVTSDHDQDSNNKNNYKQSKKNKRKSQGVDNSCNSGGNQWLLLPQYYWY